MNRNKLCAAFLTALIAPRASAQAPAPSADHHTHIYSQAAGHAIAMVQERTNQRVLSDEPSSLGAAEALAALDAGHVGRAAVMSSAYLFGMPEMAFENEPASVMAENDLRNRRISSAYGPSLSRHSGRDVPLWCICARGIRTTAEKTHKPSFRKFCRRSPTSWFKLLT